MDIHFILRFSNEYESSRRILCFFACMPCLCAFIEDRKRPSGVVGPVDFWLFRLFAATCFSEAILKSPLY